MLLIEARERLYNLDASDYLSSYELLALVLSSMVLADRVHKAVKGDLSKLSKERLEQLPGISDALISRLLAAIQLGYRARINQAEKNQITSPDDAAALLVPYMQHEQEQVRVLSLNTKNRVLGNELIYQGNTNTCIVRPKEIFRAATRLNATAIIVAHNHPSSSISASREDLEITKTLVQAGQVLGIETLDHLIIADEKWLSIKTAYPHLF